MLRLLCDENFNGDIVRGLGAQRHSIPAITIDVVRVQEVGLSGAADSDILAWAAANDRIVVTHDRATMPDHAYTPKESRWWACSLCTTGWLWGKRYKRFC
jgi:predicted nuclease of predicted toxin-antitoxin system